MVVVGRARALTTRRARELGHPDLADDAALVASELVTNALLHGGGCRGIRVTAVNGGLRVEVRDGNTQPPLVGFPSEGSLTGRGLRLVTSLSVAWGAEVEDDGKVLWADVTGVRSPDESADDLEDLLAMWGDADLDPAAEPTYKVELGGVPTDLLLAAKSHVDNLVREFTLASAGASDGHTTALPSHLGQLLAGVIDRFADTRLAIKRQAVVAAGRGDTTTQLTLDLPASAAAAAEAYVQALDDIDAYCRARRLLTLETPPQHRVFRHWYVEELVRQLRAAVTGAVPAPAQTFESRLRAELGSSG